MTETSDPEQKNAQHAANVAGCVGAMLAHPVAMALAFAHGFIYGATPMAHGPAPASGLNGGAMAAKQLLVFYFFSFGILPLAISGIGLWFGYWLNEVFGGRHPAVKKLLSTQPSSGWTIAAWASGTYLAAYAAGLALHWLLRFTCYPIDEHTIGRVTLMYLVWYAVIWGGGAVFAYFRHHSLRLSLWLIAIAFLLRLVLPWIHLPPYSLHAVALCILVYAIVTKRLKPPEKQDQNPTANTESAAPEVRG